MGALLLAACAKSDGALKQRVEARIRAEHFAEPVDVSIDERIVTLRGVVHSAQERTRLDAVVRSVDGVRGVENRLLVQEPPSLTAATPDAEETATISSALDAAGIHGVHVEVHFGTVYLRGKVKRGSQAAVMRTVHDVAPALRVEDQTTLE